MGLLRDFVDRLRQGTFPGWREPDAVQELFAACVKRDLGAKAVFLAGSPESTRAYTRVSDRMVVAEYRRALGRDVIP